MRSNFGLLKKVSMLALGLFLLLPTVSVSAQWGNNQRRDRRDDRYERRDQRRDDRWDRRDQRRDDRWDRREGRRGRGDNYPNYGGSFQLRQTALNAGYNSGIERGRRDRNRGERFDPSRHSDYRNANKDYSSRLGDRYIYQRYFRDAFQTGYRDGYNGY